MSTLQSGGNLVQLLSLKITDVSQKQIVPVIKKEENCFMKLN